MIRTLIYDDKGYFFYFKVRPNCVVWIELDRNLLPGKKHRNSVVCGTKQYFSTFRTTALSIGMKGTRPTIRASMRLFGICLKAVKTLVLIILIKWLVIVGNILEGLCAVDREFSYV